MIPGIMNCVIVLLYIQAQLFLWEMLPIIYVYADEFLNLFSTLPDSPLAWDLRAKRELRSARIAGSWMHSYGMVRCIPDPCLRSHFTSVVSAALILFY